MLIVHGCAVILFAILGIVFFCGKGSSLIAGYNTASPEEKAKYDEKALCHTMGGMMFACAACFGVLMVSDILKSLALMWVGIVSFFIVIVGGVIYMNTSNKVKRK